MRLTLGPGAYLPLDATAEPIVAHISVTTYTGHVVMYISDGKIMIRDTSDNIQKVPCPPFVLQPGHPPDECVCSSAMHQFGQRRSFIGSQDGIAVWRLADS